jgi:hypothetical protein
MNFKTTIMLIVLLALLGGAWYLTRDTPGRETIERERAAATPDRGGTAVFSAADLPTERVSRLTLVRGDETIVIAREDQAWRQVEPVSFPISEWQGRTLVDRVATMRYADRFTPGRGDNPTLAELGLDAPAAVVTLDISAGDDAPARTQTVRIGRTIASAAYIQINDDPHVYAVNADVHRLLVGGKVADWRARSPTAPSEGAAERITLEREGQRIELTKIEGRWMLDPVRGDRADTDAVRGLIGGISSLYINEFVTDKPAADSLAMYGLDRPRLTIRVETADESLQVLIGGPFDLARESFFATWVRGDEQPMVVFTLGKAGIERFEKPADDLRDKRITLARLSEVNELTVRRRGQPDLHVVKKPEGWSFADDSVGYAVDTGALNELLDAFIDARAVGFVTEPSLDGEPQATVVLNLVGGKAPERLSLYTHKTGDDKATWLVVRDGEKTGYVVVKDRLDAAFKPQVSLRSREVMTLPREQIAAMRIERGEETFTLRREPSEGDAASAAWTIEGHDRVEGATATMLLGAVSPVRAEMWLGPEEVEAGLTITLTPFEGDAVTLRIDPESRVAQGPWAQGVIVVPQSLIDAAKAEFRYRTVLPIKVEDIREVALTRGSHALTVLRDAAGRYRREDGGDLLEADAGALYDELAGLRADRFREASVLGSALAQPTTTITLQLTDGTTRVLGLWPPSDNDLREHLGRIDQSPLVFTLSETAIGRLVKLLDQLADAAAPAPQP